MTGPINGQGIPDPILPRMWTGKNTETAVQLRVTLDALNGLLDSSMRGHVVQGVREVLQARASSQMAGPE